MISILHTIQYYTIQTHVYYRNYEIICYHRTQLYFYHVELKCIYDTIQKSVLLHKIAWVLKCPNVSQKASSNTLNLGIAILYHAFEKQASTSHINKVFTDRYLPCNLIFIANM